MSGTIKTTKLSRAAVLAAMASGASLSQEEQDLAAAAAAAAEPDPAKTDPAPAKTQEEQDAEKKEGAETDPKPQASATAPDLSAQLVALSKENATLALKVENLTADLAAANEASESARGVLRTTVERLGIALGSTVIGLKDASLSALCAHYSELNTEFTKRFPVGGVARAVVADDPKKSEVQDNAELTRRLGHTKTSKARK